MSAAAAQIIRGPGPRALVIGSHGALGSLLGDAFAAAGWDLVGTGRRALIAPGYLSLDLAAADEVGAAIEGFDVVVNTVADPALTAERAVLERGGLLINVSGMSGEPQRRLRAAAKDPRGAVVVGAGIAPGLTSLIAADLLAAHPQADEIELALTVSTKATAGPAGGRFAHRGLTARRRHRTRAIPLPEPFGRRRCLGFAEPDRGWIGDLAGTRSVSPYLCIAELGVHRAMLGLNALGLISRLPPTAFSPGRRRRQRISREPVAHWIAIAERGRRIAARTLECDGDYAAAARSTVILAEALLADGGGAPPRLGVFTPEQLVSLHRLTPELARAGIEVVERAPTGEMLSRPAPPPPVELATSSPVPLATFGPPDG